MSIVHVFTDSITFLSFPNETEQIKKQTFETDLVYRHETEILKFNNRGSRIQ